MFLGDEPTTPGTSTNAPTPLDEDPVVVSAVASVAPSLGLLGLLLTLAAGLVHPGL